MYLHHSYVKELLKAIRSRCGLGCGGVCGLVRVCMYVGGGPNVGWSQKATLL